ncbi:MAG: ATP-binding cassette domain-containing protein [Chloroflexota bacterium]|nr:ATP-binding cassette domain-containing protein [Chloroflexota bacterium]
MSRQRYAPLPWLLWALGMLIIAYTTRNPLYLALASAALWVVAESVRQPLSLRLYLTLIGFGAAWNLLSAHNGATVLFTLPLSWPLLGGPFTVEAALYGALNGLALALILSASRLLIALLSPRELVRLTPPALYEAGLVLSIALAFLPQGRETLEEIEQAQAVRGHAIKGVRDLLPLLLPLLIASLERALQLAESLEARGFTAGRREMSRRTSLLLLAALLALLLGSGASLLPWPRWLGPLLLTVGLLGLSGALWSVGRRSPRTRYLSRRATRAELALSGASLLAAGGWVALRLCSPTLTAYSVYPQLTAPPFSLLAALPILLLTAPALLRPGSRPASPPPAPETLRERHAPAPRITFEHVTFTYPEAAAPALTGVSLTIPPGSFVLLVGPSGAGKSTLLRCINGLVPHTTGGRIAGRVWVGARDTLRTPPAQLSRQVGLLPQSPEASFVTDHVDEEIAFTLENFALSPGQIAARLVDIKALLGLTSFGERPLSQLSGGEKAKVALAAAFAFHPQVLLLDEPLGQLDAAGTASLLASLRALHARGVTIIIAEHRLRHLLPLATQIFLLTESGSLRNASPGEAAALFNPPLETVVSPLPQTSSALEPALSIHKLKVSYPDRPVLNGFSLALRRGEFCALVGPNGAGKTTLLRAIVGLVTPQAGQIWLGGAEITAWDVAARCRRIGYLPQNPDLLLFAETVQDELRITLKNHGLPTEGRVEELLAQLGLDTVADAYPRDLSVGQRQRVALGAIAVTRPDVLLLDEPTRGLDLPRKRALARLLRRRCTAEGLSVLVATHDVEWITPFADRVINLSSRANGHARSCGRSPDRATWSDTFTLRGLRSGDRPAPSVSFRASGRHYMPVTKRGIYHD